MRPNRVNLRPCELWRGLPEAARFWQRCGCSLQAEWPGCVALNTDKSDVLRCVVLRCAGHPAMHGARDYQWLRPCPQNWFRHFRIFRVSLVAMFLRCIAPCATFGALGLWSTGSWKTWLFANDCMILGAMPKLDQLGYRRFPIRERQLRHQ